MQTTIWALDAAHSELTFKVRHLMISTVTGNFGSFKVEAETEGADFAKMLAVKVEADVSSINTNNVDRDAHLRSADFFDTEKFALITFEGTSVDTDGYMGTLHGNLTIRDVTKAVALDIEIGGVATDGYGQTKAGFTVTGKISRKEFGLTWNALTSTGGAVVGDDVKINAEIQLIKQG